MKIKNILIFVFINGILCKQHHEIFLKAIHHHKEGTKKSLEHASFITLFSGRIIPTVLEKKSIQNITEVIFLLPHALFTEEITKNQYILIEGSFYKALFTKVVTPLPGILCTVKYNNNELAFVYETIKKSDQTPGFNFKFLNKNVLTKLDTNNQTHSLITIAQYQPRIAIDAGHGGKDLGACGNGIIEKNITLMLSHHVAQALRNDGYEAFLVRSHDTDMALAERTSYAHALGADIYLSIHANASENNEALGIETFFYPQPENAINAIDNLQYKKEYEKYLEKKNQQTEFFAQTLHKTVCQAATHFYQEKSFDRKTKKAAFQVLIGFKGPAALLEVGFLSNNYDATLLKQKTYLFALVKNIASGIKTFIKEYKA